MFNAPASYIFFIVALNFSVKPLQIGLQKVVVNLLIDSNLDIPACNVIQTGFQDHSIFFLIFQPSCKDTKAISVFFPFLTGGPSLSCI